MRIFVLPLAAFAFSGCTVAEVVTAPIDALTTTQSEADYNRGKALRKREERLEKLQRQYPKRVEECAEGDAKACAKAEEINAEIEALLPTIPKEPTRR